MKEIELIKEYLEKSKINFILKVSLFGSNSINRDKLKRPNPETQKYINPNLNRSIQYIEKKDKNNLSLSKKESDIDLCFITYKTDLHIKQLVINNLNHAINSSKKIDALFIDYDYYLANLDNSANFIQEILLTEEILFITKDPRVKFVTEIKSLIEPIEQTPENNPENINKI